MNAGALIRAIWDESRSNIEIADARTEMIDILKDDGYFVAESVDELRVMALEETDLVEAE